MIGASVCGESSGRCCGCLPRCHGGQALSVDQMAPRSEEHTSELQSQSNLVCRLLLEKKQDVGYADHTHYPDRLPAPVKTLDARPQLQRVESLKYRPFFYDVLLTYHCRLILASLDMRT